MELTLQGGAARLKGQGAPSGAKRGKCVVGGSRQSMRRLQHYFGAVDWERVRGKVLFCTLTLPDEVHDAEKFRLALDRFRKWLLSRYPNVGAFLRIEQGGKTGRLHGHLVIFGASYISGKLIGAVWRSKLRCVSRVRVHIEPVRSGKLVACYLRKYMVKLTGGGAVGQAAGSAAAAGPARDAGDTAAAQPLSLSNGHIWQGRAWQVWGKERIPFAPVMFFDLDTTTAARLVRVFRRLWPRYSGAGVMFLNAYTVRQLQWWVVQLCGSGYLDDAERCYTLYQPTEYLVEEVWEEGGCYVFA